MFPLGSVLFPHMPLQLRVFEQRYAIMLADLFRTDRREFGVVLIERGQEVGGGEQRFGRGTVAEITEVRAEGDMVLLAARGRRRIDVTEWLPDAPYPLAEVRELPELQWRGQLLPLLQQAEQLVRRTLALASEFAEQVWPSHVALSDDPVAAAWQLAGIAPIGPLDQVSLLAATSVEELLTGVIEHTRSAAAVLTAPWPGQS